MTRIRVLSFVSFLWYAMGGQEWALHTKFKITVEDSFTTAVEAFLDAIHKDETHMQHRD